jgi:hypothetical protein
MIFLAQFFVSFLQFLILLNVSGIKDINVLFWVNLMVRKCFSKNVRADSTSHSATVSSGAFIIRKTTHDNTWGFGDVMFIKLLDLLSEDLLLWDEEVKLLVGLHEKISLK